MAFTVATNNEDDFSLNITNDKTWKKIKFEWFAV